eukprot:m.13930 g.13930  ORF g.13930 m.13930 type:complete len:394 (+) comp3332_c0_seq1:40-1221(+)
MGWGSELWDRQEVIERHTNDGLEFVGTCRTFVGQLAHIELEYSKNLKRLVAQYGSQFVDDNTSCMAAWKATLTAVDDVASSHESASSALLADVCSPLKQLIKARTSERNDLLHEAAKLRAELAKAMSNYDKAKKRHEKTEKDAEAAYQAFEKAERSDAVKAKIEKARLAWAQKAKTCEASLQGLQQELDVINNARTSFYYTDLPAVFDGLQALDENRAAGLVANFGVIAKCYHQALDSSAAALRTLDQAVLDHNKTGDSELFARLNKSGEPLPEGLALPTMAGPAFLGSASPKPSRSPAATSRRRPETTYEEEEEEEPPVRNSTAAAPPPPPKPAAYPQCYCLYAFPGTNDGELCAAENEYLSVVTDDGSGWVLCMKNTGEQGYVPASYIQYC